MHAGELIIRFVVSDGCAFISLQKFYALSDPKQVKPYNNREDKKSQVARMFDNIAPRYDLLNRVLSAGIDIRWRNRVIKSLAPHKPENILDVATGTADLAIAMAKAWPQAQITGADISNQMLAIGRKKTAKKKLDDRITLEYGDSEQMSYPDNTFDAVTVAFGVRNFENLEAGLKEMYRVLKPGSPLAILEFSKPKMFPLAGMYDFYFKHVLPRIGRLTSKDPKAYSYLYESVQAFPEGDDLMNILKSIGFEQTTCKRLTLGICTLYIAQRIR